MKFYICNTDWDTGEKLLAQYPCLNNYGYEVTQVGKNSQASIMYNAQQSVNIDNLEQLLQLHKDLNEAIIIHHGEEKDPTLVIEIYDNYRE